MYYFKKELIELLDKNYKLIQFVILEKLLRRH